MNKDAILKEARERFTRAMNWERHFRSLGDLDERFADGDAYNNAQWPQEIFTQRTGAERPCLTQNIVRQHNLLVINDIKMNRPGIKFRATGGQATKKAAEIWTALARRIEYDSKFSAVLGTAVTQQVKAGIGYWRLLTEYEDANSFNQVIKIVPINNWRNVYLDPDIQEVDGSDAKFGFIFEDVPNDVFDAKYPKYAGRGRRVSPFGDTSNWLQSDHTRVAEYYWKELREDELAWVPDPEQPDGGMSFFRSSFTGKAWREVVKQPGVRTRAVQNPQVFWAIIVGNEVMETGEWAGSYIPIVRVVGEEVVTQNILDRKGHTRCMLDAQKMYNYWTSAAVEYVALQSKTPWVAAVEAVEGHEELWARANTENLPFLPYNGFGEDGQPLQAPQRPPPPGQAAAYLQGMEIARQEIMLASGQYQNQLGEQGNERTGQAITQRQRQSDKSTFHFVDNVAHAIRFTGVLILDLAPKIYDTERLLVLVGEDGSEFNVALDPNAKQAAEERQSYTLGAQLIFNPNIGKFSVVADTGPGYATRQEEAWQVMSNIITQAPALTSVIGDLLLSAGDFPLSDQAAERLRRLVPKEALGEGPTAAEKQLMEQLQQANQMLNQLTEENATLRIVQRSKEEANEIAAYKGQTERFKAIAEHLQVAPQTLEQMLGELLQQEIMPRLLQVFTSAQAQPRQSDMELAQQASAPGQMHPVLAQAFGKPPSPAPGVPSMGNTPAAMLPSRGV